MADMVVAGHLPGVIATTRTKDHTTKTVHRHRDLIMMTDLLMMRGPLDVEAEILAEEAGTFISITTYF